MQPYKTLPTIIVFLFACGLASAQNITLYAAKVYTHNGVKQGLLEKVNDKYVCLVTEKDEDLAIPICDVIKIKLKKDKGTFGQIVGRSTLGGINSFTRMYNENQDAALLNKPPYNNDDPGSLSSYLVAGALVGGVTGVIRGIRKNVTFNVGADSLRFSNIKDDLKRYARYNQIVADYESVPLPVLSDSKFTPVTN